MKDYIQDLEKVFREGPDAVTDTLLEAYRTEMAEIKAAQRRKLIDEIALDDAYIAAAGNVDDEDFLRVYEEVSTRPGASKALYEHRLDLLRCMRVPAVELQRDLTMSKLKALDTPPPTDSDDSWEPTDADIIYVFGTPLHPRDYSRRPHQEDTQQAHTATKATKKVTDQHPKKRPSQPKKETPKADLTPDPAPAKRKRGRPKAKQITITDIMPSFDDDGWS